MSFRDNYEIFKESIKSGEMKDYISGKYKGVKGKVRGAKDFAKSSAGKKAIKHIILWRVLPILLPLVIIITTIIVIYSSIRSQVDSVIQAATNWVTIESNDDEDGYLHESYVVTPDAGIPGCILRPQTGIYADSKIASGVGIYKAQFPSDLPNLQQVLEKPDVKSNLQEDANNGLFEMSLEKTIEQRGLTKSYMGLQVMCGGGSKPVGYADSYPNLWCIKNNSHDESEAKGNIDIQSYSDYFDSNGFFRVANRYGIAVKPGYATLMGYERQFKPGDYIDVYLDNGNVIQCILIDVKRQGKGAGGGKETTNYVVHNDGSIVEFVVDKTSWYGTGLTPNNVMPEFADKITGMTLAGSWEEDKEGTGASCTKYKVSDEYKTEGTVSSISSNSSGGTTSGGTTSGGTASVVKADFPSNVKTMEQVIKEDGKASISAQTARGKTKSLMGWQTQGTKYSGGLKSSQLLSQSDSYLLNRIPHDYNGGGHATDDKVGEHSSEMLPQWVFMYAAHNDNHNWDECNKAENKMRRKDINKFNSDGLAYVNGRYVVAVKPGLGQLIWGEQTKIGDAIDIYLDDGTIIPAWVGEQKGAENSSNVIHSDGSIVEFIVDCNKFYDCCVNTHDNSGVGKITQAVTDIYKEWNQPIKGITKVGNWFENDGKVDSPVGNAEVTQEETGGMAYLDENGQPCDPNGEQVECTGMQANPGRRTYLNMVLTARQALGKSIYDQTDIEGIRDLIGVPDKWEAAFNWAKEQDKEWDWHTMNAPTNLGGRYTEYVVDCSKFVSWTVNNVLNASAPFESKNSVYAFTGNMDSELKKVGFKKVGTTKSMGYEELQIGDILNSDGWGHVVIVVGKESDGSVVIIHSSPNGVKLGGTHGQSAKLAEDYMAKYVPEFPSRAVKNTGFNAKAVTLGSGYLSNYSIDVYRGDGVLEDPDGVINMSASEILAIMFGESGGNCQNNTNSGGKTIFLDPGHGINLDKTEATMVANGYLNNGGNWGEWRHYGSEGTVGTNCKNCGKDGSHKCWFNYDPRGKTEPDITWGICSKLKPLLEQAGFKVVMSRTENEHPSVTKRAEDAQKAGADIQICVHSNSDSGPGTAYCDPTGSKGSNSYKGSDWLSNSIKLNQMLNKGIVNSGCGLVEHSPIPDYGYLILYEKATCPTAYLEIGDMGNSHDLSILQSSDGQQKIAEGILAGVKEYYGMK